MIKFQGNVSDECKKYIAKKENMFMGGFYDLLFLIATPVIITLAIKIDLILLIILLPFVFFIIYGYFAPMAALEVRLPLEITIEEDILTMTSNEHSVTRNISEIREIVDRGNWYDIHFKNYFKKYRASLYFVCEKKLLTEGTIEEFETRFQDLLIKGDSKKHGKG